MKQKIGQPVVFGDIIQLRHLKSGKFLNLIPTQVANDERENLTITLDTQGSPYSWIEVAPRYKIDRIGDNVQTNTEIYLRVSERKNEYIHAADRHITTQRPREVNCSLEPTSWRINIFTSSVDFTDSTLLVASDMVSIFDAETKSHLTIMKKDAGCVTANDDDDDAADDESSVEPSVVTAGSSLLQGGSLMAGVARGDSKDSMDSDYDGLEPTKRQPLDNGSFCGSVGLAEHEEADANDITFKNGVCEVVIRPSDGALNSNAIWIMESETLIKGGPIEWKTQSVRFKNLNTGLYLIVEEMHRMVDAPSSVVFDDEAAEEDDELGTVSVVSQRVLETYYAFATTEDREDPRTLLLTQEIYSTRPELSVSKPVQLYSTQVSQLCNMWVGRGEQVMVEGDNKVSSYFLTEFFFDKNDAVSFLINRYSPSDMISKDVIAAADEGSGSGEAQMPMDVHTGVALRVFFEKYLGHTVLPKALNKIPTFWPKLTRADMTLFENVTLKCTNFAKGFHISDENPDENEKPSPSLRTKRQNLLREQGVLEVLLEIIHVLIPLSKKMDDLIRDSAPMETLPDAVKQLFAMSATVLGCCLDVVYNAISDNTDTQLYVANFMPILLAHLNAHPLAGSCVTEMLNNNMELQETKIGNREISIFVDKLKQSKYNGMYLRLLQSCCSCQGDGVDGNQRKIVLRLLESTQDCLMTVAVDYKVSIFMRWYSTGSDDNIFIPEKLMNSAEENDADHQNSERNDGAAASSIAVAAQQAEGGWASAVPSRQSSFKSGMVGSIPNSRQGSFKGNTVGDLTPSLEGVGGNLNFKGMSPAPSAGGRPSLMQRSKSFLALNANAPVAPAAALKKRSLSDKRGLSLEVAPVKGAKLVTDGVPRLFVTWVSSNVEFSPQGIFGKVNVPIEELFPLNSMPMSSPNTPGSKGGKRTSMMGANKDVLRQKIADYFVAELFLGAELCMDQNYVSMLKLDPYFEYETLISMLRVRVNDEVKAGATRLLHYLYVDRCPNSKIPVPRLSRGWTDVESNPTPSLPHVADDQTNQFAILQHIVSEHVKGMKGVRWTPLSLHMLRVLNCMLNFNFYGTREKLRDVIFPLIATLDRRNVIEVEEKTKSRTNTPGKANRRESLAALKKAKSEVDSEGGSGLEDSNLADGSNKSQSGGDNSLEIIPNSDKSAPVLPGPPKVAFEKRLLDFMNSIPVMLGVLSVVLVAVAEVFLVVSFGYNNEFGSPLSIFEIVVAVFFVAEISVRGWAYYKVHGQLKQFFKSVFNQIDVLVILIDVVFLSLPPGLMSGGGIVKVLRLARLFRLLRLAKAAKVATAIVSVKKNKKITWQLPARYTKLPTHELEAMVEASSVLVNAQNRIDDRNISLFLRYFYLWQSGQDSRSMAAIFDQIMQEYAEVSLETEESDAILMDLLLFSDPKLIQSILDVFMAIYSARRMFLVNARSIQLIVSSKREKQFKQIELWVLDLDRTVETQELWGELETADDRNNSDIIWSVMRNLIEVICLPRSVLEFDQFRKADREVQDILRNLGFLETIMKVINLLERVEEEELDENETAADVTVAGGSCDIGTTGEMCKMSEGSINTLKQVQLANRLLYWFLYRNKENQDEGYEELEFFMETLDKNIGSHLVIKSMFECNEKVCKQCPFETVELMANLICKEGQKHYYLTLLEAITHAGEKHIIENQFQVVKVLTNPEVVGQVVRFFVPTKSAEYKEKQQLMAPFLGVKDIDVETLPDPLKYHITLLETLSSCTISNSNMATIEAKAQALYFYYDIVKALLDNKTLLLCKIKLAMYFFNSTVDVEMSVPGLDHSAVVWTLIQSYANVFVHSRDELRAIEKSGWEAPNVSRQSIEYMLVCVRITCSFFTNYYNPQTFRPDDIAANAGDAMKLTMSKINAVIHNLFQKLSDLYEADSPCLSRTHKQWIFDAMWATNRAASSIIVVHIENTHDGKRGQDAVEGAEDEGEDDAFAKTNMEIQTSKKYEEYVSLMEKDKTVQASITEESFKFVEIIEGLPRVDDGEARADVRYEAILRKLTGHCRSCFKIVRGEKNLDSAAEKVTLWLLRVFLTMIEKRWGMTLERREAVGGEEQDKAAEEVIESLDSCGVTMLCLDAIAVGIDTDVQIAAVKLLIALLVKDGGSKPIQTSVYDYLTRNRSDLFFKQIRKACNELIDWHRWIKLTGSDETSTEFIHFIRCLQLCSVGHFLPNQELFRNQNIGTSPNTDTICLLDDFVNYLTALSKMPSRVSTTAAIKVVFMILTTIQGPCEDNQYHYAVNTQLLEALNRLMRAKPFPGCVHDDEIQLKILTVGCFQGLLEGQGSKRAVYEKFLGVIHLDILQLLCEDPKHAAKKKSKMPPIPRKDKGTKTAKAVGKVAPAEGAADVEAGAEGAGAAEGEGPSDEVVAASMSGLTEGLEEEEEKEQVPVEVETERAKDLRIKAIVLLRSLMDYDPNVEEILGLTEKDTKKLIGDQTASIEIVWRGELQRRFFRIPDLCRHLASSSRNAFVEEADRSTIENKLLDFFDRAHVLYREIAHQEKMTKLGIAKVFSKQNYDRSTWSAFFLAVLVNFLFICLYRAPNGVDPFVSETAERVIFALNIFQIALAAFNVVMNIVVRCPVIYQGYLADGESPLYSLLYTAQDPMTLYYFLYTMLAFVGVAYDNIFLIFLLFDIVVKNSTVRDILNSVVIPRYQLMMASLLGVFVIYILTFFAFYFYNDEFVEAYPCDTLWACFKIGLRSMATDGGLGELMQDNIGMRIFLTMAYFFGVMIVLLNIIFGITIDTFGALREAKNIRLEDTAGICFICGIENLVFDRIERDGFESHIRQDHYMWNYFYFITYIWEQNKDNDDGFEGYVRHCVEKSDITWFPINKALRLRSTKTAKDVLRIELQQELKRAEGGLTAFWSKLEHEARDKFLIFKSVLTAIQDDSNNRGGCGGAGGAPPSAMMARMRSNDSPAPSSVVSRQSSGTMSPGTGAISAQFSEGEGDLPASPKAKSALMTQMQAANVSVATTMSVDEGLWDLSLQVVELSGDLVARMVKNTLVAQGHQLNDVDSTEVFFELTISCPNFRSPTPQTTGAAPTTTTITVRTSIEYSASADVEVVFPPAITALGNAVSVETFGNTSVSVLMSVGAHRPEALAAAATGSDGEQLSGLREEDKNMMDIASWDMTVSEIVRGSQGTISKAFPPPYASVSLVISPQCKRPHE